MTSRQNENCTPDNVDIFFKFFQYDLNNEYQMNLVEQRVKEYAEKTGLIFSI